jgi:ComF family protein
MGAPLVYDIGEGAVSGAAAARTPEWDQARAAVLYNDQSRRLVHALKYHDRHDAAEVMARMMHHAGRRLLDSHDLLAPVPLHWLRLWSRRYNQSALLARRLGKLAAVPVCPDLILRCRQTRSQVGLSARERNRNIRGAFAVRDQLASRVAGRKILLIDDVMTSGATANECARVLRGAGAMHVAVLVFALVWRPS